MKKSIVLVLLLSLFGVAYATLKTMTLNGNKFVSITSSLTGDSTYVKDTTWLLGNATNYRNYMLRVVIGAAASTQHGFGNKDTARIVLKSQWRDLYYTLDSSLKTSIPCTLLVAHILNDTLVKENLMLCLYMADTCSDTVQTTKYPVKWDLIVKE